MNVSIRIEKYVFMEIMNTLAVAISWVSGTKRDPFILQEQWGKLVEAIHLFMLDIEVVEFKDLKLPSEEKREEKRNKKDDKPKPKAVQQKVKQLTLFCVKYTKKALFHTVVAIEFAIERMKDFLVKNESDFENRIRQ